jgi:4-carboxymuconolactone decarboxylase
MARLTLPQKAQLSTEQQRLYDEFAGPRGGSIRGPFSIWLHTPAIAQGANQMAMALRLNGQLEKRLFELTVLIVIRRGLAQFPWFVHRGAALEAGLTAEVIDAIEARRTPPLARDDERVIYDLVNELVETKSLRKDSYQRGLALLGRERLIELVTVVGYYTMITMVVNSFDVDTPDNSRPLS